MWVLKIKVESKNQFLGPLAVKHKVYVAGYPLSYYKDEKWLYLKVCGFISGEEKNKKSFFKALKKQPWTVEYELKNDFAVGIMKQPLFTEPIWSPRIFWIAPIIVDWKEKKHTWHVASFERKNLANILKFAKKHLGAELLKFKEEKISNISFTRILPELTKKQKKAFEIAITNGYYKHPRKIHIEKLAKIMGVSYSTFQEHLRKAEEKIIPNVYTELEF